ncbi:hypothetical protein P8452_34401 [Trifolium repens]|nr:hypothetical protein P8452_34401 [Trifolium repens]
MPFGFGFNLNLNFNLFNNEEANARKPTTERNVITFEEGLKTLQEGIVKLFNILEGLEPNFTPEEHIMLYTTVYNLCSPNSIPSYDLELYNLYKQICEDYITSKVLPSLQEKKDETLLTILLERWSNYKIMTKRLASFFSHLDRFFLQRYGYPNLEKTSFLSFYHLVYEEMNQEIMDAISAAMVYDEEMHQEIKDDMSAMIDRKLAGEKFEYTFVINTLDFYLRFDEWTRKNRKMDVLSKKLNLISPDGAVFEVDYDVALMSSRFNNILETIPVFDVDYDVALSIGMSLLVV